MFVASVSQGAPNHADARFGLEPGGRMTASWASPPSGSPLRVREERDEPTYLGRRVVAGPGRISKAAGQSRQHKRPNRGDN